MDIKRAIEKHLVFKTEYGGGPSALGGLVKHRILKRQRYLLDGEKKEDKIFEWEFALGPVVFTLRKDSPNPFDDGPKETTVSILKLFAVTNDQEMLFKFKTGMNTGLMKLLLAASPARLVAEAVDLDVAARAGVRFNITRLMRDIKGVEADGDEAEDVDLN